MNARPVHGRPTSTDARIEVEYVRLAAIGLPVSYHALLLAVFPPTDYPRAHRVSVNGGPPGCAMTFGAALRRLGGNRSGEHYKDVWLPYLALQENVNPTGATTSPKGEEKTP